MGVKHLMKFIEKYAPFSLHKTTIANLFGRVIAIDASLQIYQFLVSVRHADAHLTDSEGNSMSHLQGLLSRSGHFIQNGIRPIYVFDGAPPDMKRRSGRCGTPSKRATRRRSIASAGGPSGSTRRTSGSSSASWR
jgi:hypothetical protein